MCIRDSRPAHLIHHAQCYGPDGRAGKTRKYILEHRAARGKVDSHGLKGVHKAQAVCTGLFTGKRHFGDVFRVGAQLYHQRLFGARAHARHHFAGALRTDAVSDAPGLHIRAGNIQLYQIYIRAVQKARTLFKMCIRDRL